MMLCNSIRKEDLRNINLNDFFIEVKEDGCRCMYFTKDNKFINRNGVDIREKYPEIPQINGDYVLDGELVYKDGIKSDFNKLSIREHNTNKFKIELLSKKYPATFIIFDIIKSDCNDLINITLKERKEILANKFEGKQTQFIQLIKETTIQQAETEQQEGVILKQKDSKYQMGVRSDKWLKLKFVKEKIILFKTYEVNPDSITLVSDDGIRVKCSDPKVKGLIDKNKEVSAEIEYLEETIGNKLRFPIYKRVI